MNRLLDDAMLADACEAHELAGLSGARVFILTKDGRHWLVRKSARDEAASARLAVQARKQRTFASAINGVVRTPRILDEGQRDGRFYYDMEFVHGLDGASFLRQATYGEVVTLADRLCEYLRVAADSPPLCPAGAASMFEALFAKICAVERTVGSIASENIARLLLALDPLRTIGPLPPTLCHGDMTLQNLVVDPTGVVWVVDLLDSPFEHYWMDVAKLHQDLSGGWFLREQPPVARCALEYVGRRLRHVAGELNPAYAQVHSLLVASTFVRILPYARTPEEMEFVNRRIDFFARQTLLREGD